MGLESLKLRFCSLPALTGCGQYPRHICICIYIYTSNIVCEGFLDFYMNLARGLSTPTLLHCAKTFFQEGSNLRTADRIHAV